MCGIFAVCNSPNASRISVCALHALQHRGTESSGMVSYDGKQMHEHQAMGLVSAVYKEPDIERLQGDKAIGHNRYSTMGHSTLKNAQPVLVETSIGPIAIAENGNITNAGKLRNTLLNNGVGLSSSSDGEIVAQLIAGSHGDIVVRLTHLMDVAEGAYSLVILSENAIYGLRDKKGIKPLCIGCLPDNGFVLSSEVGPFYMIGAEYVRDIQPGEIVRLCVDGLHSVKLHHNDSALCSFELIYFSRPDNLFNGCSVHSIRQRLGRKLAEEAPVDVDIVSSVPRSGTPSALGYADAVGIPYNEILLQNGYVGRTFIEPHDDIRKQKVSLKFSPIPDNIEGRKIVLIDDSIVRCNTMGPIIKMLKEHGAREIHVRISSPPIKHPCFMGINMSTENELIARHYTIDGIKERINATSLAYLSIDGLLAVLNDAHGMGYCMACFDGEYPVKLYSKC
jgi:amidophosphoribosyltransferase